MFGYPINHTPKFVTVKKIRLEARIDVIFIFLSKYPTTLIKIKEK